MFGPITVIDRRREDGVWVLICLRLTRAVAEQVYGQVTEEERGPRGGWRSITFGTTRFASRL